MFYVFLVLVFGSKSAPTVWGRYSAWLGRSVSLLTLRDHLRAEIYVDDPIFALAGSGHQKRKEVCIALAWLLVVGFPIAWNKAEAGSSVRWIGIDWSLHENELRLSANSDKAPELEQIITQTLNRKAAQAKKIRKIAGSLAFIASAIPLLKAFIDPIWAALRYPRVASNSAHSFIPVKSIEDTQVAGTTLQRLVRRHTHPS